MMTPRIMAFRQLRPRGAGTRCTALACRVEALEPRFLLATTGVAFHTLGPEVPIVFQAAYGQIETTAIPEQASPHATEATAQVLPLDMNVNLTGVITGDGPPAVFRVPLDVANFPTIAIAMGWTQGSVPVAGRVRVLDNLGRTLVDQPLSASESVQSLSVALWLDTQPAPSSLFIQIVPASAGAASAGFVLSVQPQAGLAPAPQAQLADGSAAATTSFGDDYSPAPPLTDTGTIFSTEPVSGNTSSSSGSSSVTGSPPSVSGPGPGLGPIAGTPSPSPPRLTVPLPLPATSAQPAAGIFVTAEMIDSQVHEVAAVVADLSFLGVGPAASSITAIVAAPSGTVGAGSAIAPGPENELWAGPLFGRRENGAPAPNCTPAQPPCLAFGLPPSGVMALAPSRTDPASARLAPARPALPRLVEKAVAAECPEVAPIGPIVASADFANRRRPRAVAALLYGSFCAMIGVVASEWTQVLRPPVRAQRRRGQERLGVG